MWFSRYLAGQLRQPSGLFGREVMGRLLNGLNRPLYGLVLDRLRLQPSDRVLEVGFGGGALLAVMGEVVTGGLVAGVEVSAEMVAFCSRRLASQIESGRVDLRCASVERLPYPDRHFDKACAVDTIYFWEDTTQGLKELKRVLRPGGTLAVGFVGAESMRALAPYGCLLLEPREVEWALQLAGFRQVGVERGHDWRGEFYCVSGVA